MSFDLPCTHPDGWPCNRDDSGLCGTQASHGKWIEQSATTEQAGSGTSFSRDPDVVGDVDMTPDDRKLSLGVTGNSEAVALDDDLQDLNDVRDVDVDALAEWRARKERKSP